MPEVDANDVGGGVEFLRDVRQHDRVQVSEQTLDLKVWAYVAWQVRGAAGPEFIRD